MGEALLTVERLSAWYSNEKMILSYFTFREYLAYVCAAYDQEVPDVSELIQGFHFEEYTDTLLRKLSTGNQHF